MFKNFSRKMILLFIGGKSVSGCIQYRICNHTLPCYHNVEDLKASVFIIIVVYA